MHTTRERRWALPLALATVYLAWGGTYPAIRVMVETVPPLLGTAARFALAGLLLTAFLLLRGGRRRLALSRRQLLGASAVGVVILGDIGLLALAEQEVPAGLAALIIASVPLWIVLLRLARSPAPGADDDGGRGRRARRRGPSRDPDWRVVEPPLGWLLLLVAAAAIEAAGQFYSSASSCPRTCSRARRSSFSRAATLLALAGVAIGETGELVRALLAGSRCWRSPTWSSRDRSWPTSPSCGCSPTRPSASSRRTAYVNPVVAVALGWALLSASP